VITLPDADDDPVQGILGGLEAYLAYMDCGSREELEALKEDEQLTLYPETLDELAA
jgi:hypothetical protein